MADVMKYFPSDKEEALAMLFLQNQDLSNLTPEELVAKYEDTKETIHKTYNPIKKKQRSSY